MKNHIGAFLYACTAIPLICLVLMVNTQTRADDAARQARDLAFSDKVSPERLATLPQELQYDIINVQIALNRWIDEYNDLKKRFEMCQVVLNK